MADTRHLWQEMNEKGDSPFSRQNGKQINEEVDSPSSFVVETESKWTRGQSLLVVVEIENKWARRGTAHSRRRNGKQGTRNPPSRVPGDGGAVVGVIPLRHSKCETEEAE